MSEELLPCPFCGGAGFDRGFRRWECGSCGAEGPCGTKDIATAGWNARSHESERMKGLVEAARAVSDDASPNSDGALELGDAAVDGKLILRLREALPDGVDTQP